MTLTTEWLKERLKNPRSGTEFELINEVLAGAYKFSGVQMAFSAWVDVRAAMLKGERP